jgi:hypothetical protein
MKKCHSIVLLLILSYNCYSQILFEKGYFIDNSNQKIECLIKNVDWVNNPTSFEYKLDENSESISSNLKTAAGFGIYNVCKYIRSTVKIDISSNKTEELSVEKNPIFEEQELFLKVLIEGKSNLYFYEKSNSKRFFFSKDTSDIIQLVHKRYLQSNNLITENNQYKQQLWNDLKCESIQISSLNKLQYTEKSLIDLFIEFNKCINSDFKDYRSKEKKDRFNLSLRARLNNSSLTMENFTTRSNVDFGSKSSFGFGIEAEFILPFNKNKWAISVEPSYQNFKSNVTQIIDYSLGPPDIYNNSISYSSIEISLGLRHYLFLNNDSKLFINGSYVLDFPMNSTFIYRNNNPNSTRQIDATMPNLASGIGYKFKNKYSCELRYQSSRNIVSDYINLNSKYSTLSLIFGYSIF